MTAHRPHAQQTDTERALRAVARLAAPLRDLADDAVVVAVGMPGEAAARAVTAAQLREVARWIAAGGVEHLGDRPAAAKPRFRELPRAQQAALLCQDARFRAWLQRRLGVASEIDADGAARGVRELLGVSSRAELDSDAEAAARWDRLLADYRGQQQGDER